MALKARFYDSSRRFYDSAEMAQRTKVATFSGESVTAIRDLDSGDLHIMRVNEQDKPERLASFHGTAWNAEATGDEGTELAVYHNSGAPIPTAMLGDRKPAKDAAARSAKVCNLVRAPTKSPARGMAWLKDRTPILEMQERHARQREASR